MVPWVGSALLDAQCHLRGERGLAVEERRERRSPHADNPGGLRAFR